MSNVTLLELNAWNEPTKSALTDIDAELEKQVAATVLSKLSSLHDVASWTDATNTPMAVKTIIAMYYISWHYDKTYAADGDHSTDDYAKRLRDWAGSLLEDLASGETDIPGEDPVETGQPAFYPTDASSALEPTSDDPSLGPAKFTMGVVW